MSKFCAVQDARFERTVYLNVNLIRFMQWNDNEKVTHLYFADSPTRWEIKETPEEILTTAIVRVE